MLEDILTYSIGSIFLGTLISVSCIGILLILIKAWNRKSLFSPITYITAGILFLILAYNCTCIIGAIAMKSDIEIMESMISQMINLPMSEYNPDIDQEVSSEIIRQVIMDNPVLNYFFGSTNFDNYTLSELSHVITNNLYDSLNTLIIQKILYSVSFIVIGAIVILKTLNNGIPSMHRSASSRYISGRNSLRNRRTMNRIR